MRKTHSGKGWSSHRSNRCLCRRDPSRFGSILGFGIFVTAFTVLGSEEVLSLRRCGSYCIEILTLFYQLETKLSSEKIYFHRPD